MSKRKNAAVNYAESSSEEDSKPVKKNVSVDQSSESDESENENEISEYEKLRLKNIEERDRLFRSLGFDKAKEELNLVSPAVKKPTRTPRPKIPKEPLPKREPSRRLRNKAARTIRQIERQVEKLKELEEEVEEKDDRLKGSMPMQLEDQESRALLERLKALKAEIKCDPAAVDLKSCSLTEFQKCLLHLRMVHEPFKVCPRRIQSILVHPAVNKQLVIAGDADGFLGFWDLETGNEGSLAQFKPHKQPVNCISVSITDPSKIYTTSHDGTIVCADLEQGIFSTLYATDFNSRIKHLTWHDQIDANSLLLSHGNGEVGILDIREPNVVKTWIPCFEKSARTVQHHPIDDNYFLVASGAKFAWKVFDMRYIRSNKGDSINEVIHPKGLTSAFFSPSGEYVVSTCNDDHLRLFKNPLHVTPSTTKVIPHNNHTGRWLSVFKAMWHPGRSDVFTIGSLLSPKRLQFYGNDGTLVGELRSAEMTTISSLISAHPTLPFIVGGNSSGKVHAFTYKPDK